MVHTRKDSREIYDEIGRLKLNERNLVDKLEDVRWKRELLEAELEKKVKK